MTESIILTELNGYCALPPPAIGLVCAFVGRDVSFAGLDLTNEPDALIGADFADTDLYCARFAGSNLTDARFDGANLNGANFSRSDLTRARFTGSDLSNAWFAGSALNYTFFQNADLTRAVFTGDIGPKLIIFCAAFEHATLESAQFINVHLVHTEFSSAHMYGVHIADSCVTRCGMSHVVMGSAMVHDSQFRKVNLAGADLEASSFTDVEFRRVSLAGCYGDVHTSNAHIRNGREPRIGLCEFIQQRDEGYSSAGSSSADD